MKDTTNTLREQDLAYGTRIADYAILGKNRKALGITVLNLNYYKEEITHVISIGQQLIREATEDQPFSSELQEENRNKCIAYMEDVLELLQGPQYLLIAFVEKNLPIKIIRWQEKFYDKQVEQYFTQEMLQNATKEELTEASRDRVWEEEELPAHELQIFMEDLNGNPM